MSETSEPTCPPATDRGHPDQAAPRPDETPRYRVTLLAGARATPEGIVHGGAGEGLCLLPWSGVREALAAEVGEPEGVRTIVFDLVVQADGGGYRACRLDAEPGEDAMHLARAVELGLGADVDSPSIKSLATDGTPSRWYPDLRTLAEDAARILDELVSR